MCVCIYVQHVYMSVCMYVQPYVGMYLGKKQKGYKKMKMNLKT